MRRKRRATRDTALWCAPAVLLALAWPSPARAYVDPGSGSFILQLAIASLMGALYALKSQWRRIRDRFGRRGAENRNPPEPHD